MSLRVQLLLLQIVIMLVTVVGTGLVATWLQERQLRESYLDRMIAVAQSVATLPSVVDAIGTENASEVIQPIAEVIRKGSDVTYVVVTDDQGIRLSHPDPSRIGEKVSTDPSIPLSGEMYVGTQSGTLGETWRVKLPIFDDSGTVVGSVSVGILESQLQADFLSNLGGLTLALIGAAVLGVLGSAWVTSVIRKRIYRLEPEQIAALLEAREAMMHGIREGLVAINDKGRIALVNDSAAQLLSLEHPESIVGQPASEVLEPALLALLDTLEPEGTLVLSGERVLVARSADATVDGRTVGRILLLRDHTELHRLLRDLDGAESLADGLRSQSHDFANKLHVISGLLELGYVDEAVGFISRAGSGGSLSSVAASTGIEDIEIAALLLAKQHRARELAVDVRVAPDSRLHHIEGADSERLRADLLTVVGNLVDNAIEACDLGGTVDVLIDQEVGEGPLTAITIEVSDDGSGIPIDQRALVFEPGVSTKAPTAGSGAHRRGIGLALVARIVERHDGTATISERPGGGTIVRAILLVRVLEPQGGAQ